MGSESNPGQYHLTNKMAKVYRKMISGQPDNLIFRERKQEKIPDWLAGKSYIDVTSAYTDVCDIVVNFEKQVPDSVDIAYLCVFNYGEWQAIQWGETVGDAAAFGDMGVDIVYLPALYLNEEIEPYGAPFILTDSCTMVKLDPELKSAREINLGKVAGRELAVATDGVGERPVQPGQQYELFYWLDGWKSLGKKAVNQEGLIFEAFSDGGLYWLVADGSKKDERIFTIEDNKQVWW